MTDLPINISNVPANAAASKPYSNAEDMQQGAQDFDNVLALQLADLSTPAESFSGSSGEPYAQADDADKSAITQVENADKSLPADMLAVLLAYPQPAAAATGQPDSDIPPAINAHAPSAPTLLPVKDKGNFPDTALPSSAATQAKTGSVKHAGTKASPIAISGNNNSSNLPTPALDPALPKIGGAVPSGKGLAEVLKAAEMKGSAAEASKPALAGGALSSELLVTAPLPGNISQNINQASSAPLAIGTPLTQPAWADEFGQKITWMASQGNQSAELHLNPPQLGPLDVTIKMHGDQATALFTSPHAAVREAIEQAMPKLREILADSGIMLGNAMVSDQSARQQPEQTAHKSRNRASSPDGVSAAESTGAAETRVSHLKQHQGMVDTFA